MLELDGSDPGPREQPPQALRRSCWVGVGDGAAAVSCLGS